MQAFKITLSFKTDVTKEMQKWLVGYLQRQTLYRYIVTELDKSGKVHLHACCIWNKETRGDNIKETIWTHGYMKHQRDQSHRKFCIMINVMYDDNWYQDYLRKDANRVVLENVWEQSEVIGQYYPAKEIQEACKASGEANKSRNSNRDMCEAFQEWVNDRGINACDAIAAAEWLNRYHMDRFLLIDKRIFKQKLDLLVRITWNRWRAQEWQREVAREYGCYKGGGDVSLREVGITVYKHDDAAMEVDASDNDAQLFSVQEAPCERSESTGSEQEISEQSVYEAQEVDEV